MPPRDWNPPCTWPACGLADSAIRSARDWNEFGQEECMNSHQTREEDGEEDDEDEPEDAPKPIAYIEPSGRVTIVDAERAQVALDVIERIASRLKSL